MSFSIGIVGLPNVGKSTLFQALTKKPIDIANYPFCTIEPNVGIVEVPDKRLDFLTEMSKSEKTVPTTIEFVDIAGIVKGAYQGEGLGNKFLDNIREVDAICQVVRVFEDENITHVSGRVSPSDDIRVVQIELILKDLQTVGKYKETLQKQLKSTAEKQGKELRALMDMISKIQEGLEKEIPVRKMDIESDDLKKIKSLGLLTAKPMIFVLNVKESQLKTEISIPELESEKVLKICARLEADLLDWSETDVREFLKDYGIEHTGLDQIILESYCILNLITFLTSGPKETRAWTIVEGWKAPQAAGRIHSDFERGFISAEVVAFEDLRQCSNMNEAKEKGLVRMEGKQYEMQDGDVVIFKFSV